MAALQVSQDLSIPVDELAFTFDRSPGPGGQNVNKVSTRAELRFSVAASRALSEDQRQRLLAHLGGRLSAEGVLVLRSSRYRSQARNREDCLAKLVAILTVGLTPPPLPRRPTRPRRGAVARRLETKRKQSQRKVLRRRPPL
ncbi:MAG: alternative ribosome rescue aminoacyl-tRNA hydrolase ArfB [Candidatus Latescibacterota bacterium]